MIVGELALMRDAPRNATVVAVDDVSGWVGGKEAVAKIRKRAKTTKTKQREEKKDQQTATKETGKL